MQVCEVTTNNQTQIFTQGLLEVTQQIKKFKTFQMCHGKFLVLYYYNFNEKLNIYEAF